MDTSKKEVSSVMKSIEEECAILRPDLFSIEGKEVLETWVRN